MKKIIIVLFILLLTGCNDYTEINDLAIVTGISIDYKDNLYEVTTQLILNDKNSEIKVFKSEAPSIDEALSEISKLSNKRLFISHLKVLILTNNIIENNIDVYDFFLRNSKSKMNFYTYITDSETSNKILDIYNDEDSSLYLEKMMEFNEKTFSSTTSLKFIDLVYTKLEKGINPVYPTIKIKKINNQDVIYLDNLITYNENNKKLILNETNSIFYNILTNKTNNTTLTINCDNNNYSLEVQKIKTKFNIENNNFIINIGLKSKITNYECKEKLDIKKLNQETNNYIKNNVNDILDLIIENNNDFIGIENYYYKHNKKYNIEKINFIINVNNKTTSQGELRK